MQWVNLFAQAECNELAAGLVLIKKEFSMIQICTVYEHNVRNILSEVLQIL